MSENLLGERIKKARLKKNFSRQVLADKIGISMNGLYLYENGKRTPSSEIISRLADALDLSVDYLLGRTDHENLLFDNLKKWEEMTAKTKPVYDLAKVKNGDLKTGYVDQKSVQLYIFNDCDYWIIAPNDDFLPLITKSSYILLSESAKLQVNTIVLVNIDNNLQIKVLKRYEERNSVLSDLSGLNLIFEKDHKVFKILSSVVSYVNK